MQFSVRMELYGKCMTSIFPIMEIVKLVFLVIPGRFAIEFLVIGMYVFVFIQRTNETILIVSTGL